MNMIKNKNNNNTMKILSVIDQRVLAIRNLMSLWKQQGMTRKAINARAEAECPDAYWQHQLHEANGFKLGQD